MPAVDQIGEEGRRGGASESLRERALAMGSPRVPIYHQGGKKDLTRRNQVVWPKPPGS